jgi:CHAT domain-containing protein
VFLLDSRGDVQLEDLGEAVIIDSLVSIVRSVMHDALPKIQGCSERQIESELAGATGQLSDLLLTPLMDRLPEAHQVYISPDGQLNLLPFQILADSNGGYLIEEYTISYLSSGRDLLDFQDVGEGADPYALVLAAPDYEAMPVLSMPHLFAMPAGTRGQQRLGGPSDRTACLEHPFDPLPATQIEGETIASLLADRGVMTVGFISGADASEGRLKGLSNNPRVLHLATHGYYCPHAQLSGADDLVENPLLYSGLILAGANRMILEKPGSDTHGDDGILTSLEVSALSLTGTELVVLSACQSGVGEIENGEGVLGLRRSFQQAGARTVVMSLFDVPDASTATLMSRFYESWLAGMSKSAALREASLSILRENRKSGRGTHPLFWGGFILAGDPN